MSESDSDLDSGAETPTRRRTRSFSRCKSPASYRYSTPSDLSDSQEDSREEVAKKVAEVLGSDSDDKDKEYVPEKPPKKPRSNKKDNDKVAKKRNQKHAIERKEKKGVAENKAGRKRLSDTSSEPQETRRDVEVKETNSEPQETRRDVEAKETNNRWRDLWENEAKIDTTIKQEDERKGNPYRLCSKRRSYKRYFRRFTASNRELDVTTSFINMFDNLKENVRILLGKGDTEGVCSLWSSLLSGDTNILKGKKVAASVNTYITSYEIPDCLGLEVTEAVTNHIKNPVLSVNMLAQIGEEICSTWRKRGSGALVDILKKLLAQGAIRDLNDLVHSMTKRGNIDGPISRLGLDATEIIQDIKHIKNLVGMLRCVEEAEQEDLAGLSDNQSSKQSSKSMRSIGADEEEEKMLDEWGDRYSPFLPLLSLYYAQTRDVEFAVDFLTKFRNKFPTSFRAHQTLIDLMTLQEYDEEERQDALLQAAKQFPFSPFAVDYCKAMLQCEEDLDQSFSSEHSDPPQGSDHARHFELLVGYLDYREENLENEDAWSILLTATLNLLQTDENNGMIRQLFKHRSPWWFDQNADNLTNCNTNCLGSKLSVIGLLAGERSKASQAITQHLRSREIYGDHRASIVLAENKRIINKQLSAPLIEDETDTVGQGDKWEDFLNQEWQAVGKIMETETERKENLKLFRKLHFQKIDGTFSKKTSVKKRRHVRLRKKPLKRKKKRVELEDITRFDSSTTEDEEATGPK